MAGQHQERGPPVSSVGGLSSKKKENKLPCVIFISLCSVHTKSYTTAEKKRREKGREGGSSIFPETRGYPHAAPHKRWDTHHPYIHVQQQQQQQQPTQDIRCHEQNRSNLGDNHLKLFFLFFFSSSFFFWGVVSLVASPGVRLLALRTSNSTTTTNYLNSEQLQRVFFF